MTQEQKQLLLKDLCARLPYGIAIYRIKDSSVHRFQYSDMTENIDQFSHFLEYSGIDDIKPYLRPMSSMTEEEKNELRNLLWFGYPSDDYDNSSHRGIEINQCLYDDERYSTYDFDDFRALQTFLLKNHFDYCGFIEKGLVLEAPEDMYK